MPTSDLDEPSFEANPLFISNALSVISGKWRLYIILVLNEQTLRYTQLSDLMPGVSEKMLASELKALVALGVIRRVVYAEIPSRVEYALTEKGRLALPLLRQVQQIGQLFT